MNRMKKILAAAAGGVMAATLAAPAANASTPLPPIQPNSLAAFLTGPANGGAFDSNPYDWDIVTQAIVAVVGSDSDKNSVLRAAFDGTTPVTAFLPNDRAFQVLAAEQGAKTSFFNYNAGTEQAVFGAVAAVAGDKLESILTYHVLAGATVNKAGALQSDNAQLTMANGGKVTVDVLSKRWSLIKLRDADTDDRDPLIIPRRFDLNANAGKNAQIAHGIDAVLRPINLK
jgi:hypothetical protein